MGESHIKSLQTREVIFIFTSTLPTPFFSPHHLYYILLHKSRSLLERPPPKAALSMDSQLNFTLVPSLTWERRTIASKDRISVRNLKVNNLRVSKDQWNRTTNCQPVHISVKLFLTKPIDSAAAQDNLDNSTVNYGTLSKSILNALQKPPQEHFTLFQLASLVRNTTIQTRQGHAEGAAEYDIFLPKAVLQAEGAGLRELTYFEADPPLAEITRVLYIRNLHIDCIVGLNDHERLAKQPVVVNIEIDLVRKDLCDEHGRLAKLISDVSIFNFADLPPLNQPTNLSLGKTIVDGEFKTLETLVIKVIDTLQTDFFTQGKDDASIIKLKVEKPMAVTFADAPALEVIRSAKLPVEPSNIEGLG